MSCSSLQCRWFLTFPLCHYVTVSACSSTSASVYSLHLWALSVVFSTNSITPVQDLHPSNTRGIWNTEATHLHVFALRVCRLEVVDHHVTGVMGIFVLFFSLVAYWMAAKGQGLSVTGNCGLSLNWSLTSQRLLYFLICESVQKHYFFYAIDADGIYF